MRKKINYAYMLGIKGITRICLEENELRVYAWEKRNYTYMLGRKGK